MVVLTQWTVKEECIQEGHCKPTSTENACREFHNTYTVKLDEGELIIHLTLADNIHHANALHSAIWTEMNLKFEKKNINLGF